MQVRKAVLINAAAFEKRFIKCKLLISKIFNLSVFQKNNKKANRHHTYENTKRSKAYVKYQIVILYKKSLNKYLQNVFNTY